MKKIIRYILLFLAWLILPPVFFFISKKRGITSKWKRLLLSLVSPISIICLGILLLIGFLTISVRSQYIWKCQIENEIGFEFPNYSEIEREVGIPSFNGDFSTTVVLKFKKDADLQSFYNEIKKRVDNPKEYTTNVPDGCHETAGNNWRIDVNGEYSYVSMLDCENGNDDFFDLSINSKDSTVVLRYGRW